jgi:hypothetical protein
MNQTENTSTQQSPSRRALTFEHRMMQLLNAALDSQTTIHVYGNGFHVTGVVVDVNDRMVELRLAEKTTLVRLESVCAVAV